MSNRLAERLEFGDLEFRIEKANYRWIASEMARMGCTDTDLKLMLMKGFGIFIVPLESPDLYYVVTKETMQQIAQDLGGSKFKDKADRARAILGLKIGSSQAIALTEEGARTQFLAKIARHNAEG